MRAEFKAFVDLLKPVAEIHEGDAPADAVMPYAVVIPARNADIQSRNTGANAVEHMQFTVMSVGQDVNQASWLDERIDSVLRPNRKGVELTVQGRSCTPLERRATDLSPDDSADRVWESVSSYRFTSTPK